MLEVEAQNTTQTGLLSVVVTSALKYSGQTQTVLFAIC